ncbi:hypothetical protein C8Q70DRAFT_486459 [Cubamyces menziesii]|nr:hypothetical protein C8Q70DRAFT_486459 [Cubamyces menziesii]
MARGAQSPMGSLRRGGYLATRETPGYERGRRGLAPRTRSADARGSRAYHLRQVDITGNLGRRSSWFAAVPLVPPPVRIHSKQKAHLPARAVAAYPDIPLWFVSTRQWRPRLDVNVVPVSCLDAQTPPASCRGTYSNQSTAQASARSRISQSLAQLPPSTQSSRPLARWSPPHSHPPATAYPRVPLFPAFARRPAPQSTRSNTSYPAFDPTAPTQEAIEGMNPLGVYCLRSAMHAWILIYTYEARRSCRSLRGWPRGAARGP